MVLFIPKKAICACALAAALVTLAAVVPRPSPDTVPASTAAEPRTMLVLDAGHGGEDGGAVSDSGVAESGINLQITRRLYEILRFLGHPAVMTRTGDEAIYDDAAATLREKKVSDLKNRTKLANETAGGLLISIHQNCLPQRPRRSGVLQRRPTFPTAGRGGAADVEHRGEYGPCQGRQAYRRRSVPHDPHHLPCHSGGVRLPVQPAGDGASAAAVLPNENGRRHRGGLLPILYE